MSGGKGNTHTPQNGVLLRNKTDISPFRRYARFALPHGKDMKNRQGQDKRAAPAAPTAFHVLAMGQSEGRKRIDRLRPL